MLYFNLNLLKIIAKFSARAHQLPCLPMVGRFIGAFFELVKRLGSDLCDDIVINMTQASKQPW